jgi:acetyl esterase
VQGTQKYDVSMQLDIHPDMAELIAAKQAVLNTNDSGANRAAWDSYGARLQRPYPPGMVVQDTSFSATDTLPRNIALRVYRPAGASLASPCILYIHGGGFVKGSLDSGDIVAWGVSDYTGLVVISIDYRLAPESPYPAGLEDCYAALRHAAEHAADFKIDGARIAVWGDSAGGNLAAALCLMARDKGGPRLIAQALNYPCLTDELDSASYRDHALSPGLTTASMEQNWSRYLAGARPTREAYAAPLKATDLSRLPAAHVHIAEFDPLADDGRNYAQRLAADGTAAELRVAERMIHGFLRARFAGPAAAAEFARPCEFLKRALLA